MRKPNRHRDRVQRERPRALWADGVSAKPGSPAAASTDADAPPRIQRKAGCWWALLVLPVLLLAAWALVAYIKNTFFPDRDPRPAVQAVVRQKILADLPPGSTDEQIQQWLRSNCAWHNRVVNEKTADIQYSGLILYKNWMDNGEIYLSFHRNPNGKIYIDIVDYRIVSL